MSEKTIKAVQEQWDYCGNFLKMALMIRYREILPGIGSCDWFEFLAEEFGLGEVE